MNSHSSMLGHQITLDIFDCRKDALTDQEFLNKVIEELVSILKSNIISIHVHEFDSQGLSVIGIISASHIAIHTWPENRFVAIDIFSCKSLINVEQIILGVKKQFNTDNVTYVEIVRGEGLFSPYFQVT